MSCSPLGARIRSPPSICSISPRSPRLRNTPVNSRVSIARKTPRLHNASHSLPAGRPPVSASTLSSWCVSVLRSWVSARRGLHDRQRDGRPELKQQAFRREVEVQREARRLGGGARLPPGRSSTSRGLRGRDRAGFVPSRLLGTRPAFDLGRRRFHRSEDRTVEPGATLVLPGHQLAAGVAQRRGPAGHYRKRGTFEDRLGEFQESIGVHLSSQGFKQNEATMLLALLAFNLNTICRNELEDSTGGGWDMRRFTRSVLRVGGRMVLRIAESA